MRCRRKQSRPVSFLTLGLTLAVASVGLAFAAWNDQLTVSTYVDTGTMSVSWRTLVLCGDNDGMPGIGQVEANRDVGDHSLMHFDITNGYPGYAASCAFTWRNTGTIPVRITSLDINGVEIPSGVSTPVDLDGDSIADVVITFENGIGSTYNPETGGGKSIEVEVLGDAPQGTPLTFTGHVNFVSWDAP